MVAVPCIEYGFLRMHGDGAGLVEGRLRVVSLPGGVPVELLEVDSPPEGPVLLGADDHSVAPSVRGPQGDLLEDSQADVPVQACLDFVLPVDGYWDRGVAWSRCGRGVDVQSEGWARHHGEGLVLANVETTCSVERPEVVF